MKLKKILATLFFMAFTIGVSAQSNQFSLGANILTSAGLSAKYGLTNNTALTGVLGFSLNQSNSHASLQGNYIIYGSGEALNVEQGLLRFYYGPGFNLFLIKHGETGIGGRLPLGLEYDFGDLPLEVYVDLAPTLDVYPSTSFYLGGSLGLRYIF